MKNLKKIAYFILIVIILVLSSIIYSNASKDDATDQKTKTLTEIKFIESKLVNLFKTMNNIAYENYKVEISKEMKSESEQSSGKGEQSSSGSQGGSSGEGESSIGESSSGGSNSNTSNEQEVKKFELKEKNVLISDDEINWDSVKSEVEILYTSIPSITLDLYQVNLNQEDVLGFNREYDNLTKAVKDENKKDTLKQLTILYDYIPKFIKNVNEEELFRLVLETKAQIFKAYSKLEDKDWEGISNDLKNAIDTFGQLLTSTQIETSKQYTVNKIYVMLNELQNAINIQDESVFLIKYKNLLEELQNM